MAGEVDDNFVLTLTEPDILSNNHNLEEMMQQIVADAVRESEER